MNTRVTEIADRIYQLSTFSPTSGPSGLTYNVFLVDGDEPLLFHTGKRAMWGDVSEAVASVMPLKRLRWITFGHFEADECGAMNEFLGAAPEATVAHGRIGVMVTVADQTIRPPRPLVDGEVLDLGGKRMRRLETPHVPHGWDAGLFYEETTGTLFCGDLFTRGGDCKGLTGGEILTEAATFEKAMQSTSLGPRTAPTIRRLAALQPRMLAPMHNAAYTGDAGAALHGLADWYEDELRSVEAGVAALSG